MKKEEDMDQLFRDKLLNYEQEPPAYLLENILDSVAKNQRKKRLVWWRVAGVAAALVLAFVAGWQINKGVPDEKTAVLQSNQQINNQIAEKASVKEMPKSEAFARAENSPAAVSHSQVREKAGKLKAETIINAASNRSFVVDHPQATAVSDSYSALTPIYGRLVAKEGKDLLRTKSHPEKALTSGEKNLDDQIIEMNKMTLARSDKNKTKAQWSFGAQVSPEYNGVSASQSQTYANNMIKTQSKSVDLGGGISIEFKKGKRWSVQSGVYYSGIGQAAGGKYGNSGLMANSDYNYSSPIVNVDVSSNRLSMNSNAGVVVLSKIPVGMVLSSNLDDKNGFSSALVVSNTEFIQDFDYVEVPLYLRYSIIDKKIGIDLMGGLSSNFLVGNRLYVDGSSGKTLVGKTSDMETFNYSGTFGVGLKYGLTKRLSVTMEPRVKYFLNSLSNNSEVTFKPYTFGVFTGLSYDF